MTLKNEFGKCSLFVLSANGWKDQNMDSSFSRQRKHWRRHCSIGQSCCSMTSKLSIDWFLESSRAWSFFTRAFAEPTKRHARLYPFDKPIKSLYSRSLLFMFCCTFSIQSHKKIALLEIFQYRNSHDLYVLMYPSVKIRPCPHESERCKITQFCTRNKSGSENSVSYMS